MKKGANENFEIFELKLKKLCRISHSDKLHNLCSFIIFSNLTNHIQYNMLHTIWKTGT